VKVACIIAWMACAAAITAQAQEWHAAPRLLQPSQSFSVTTGVFRAIDDPATGGRWLLTRDADHPAGPGQLIWVKGLSEVTDKQPASAQTKQNSLIPLPVIHPGDRIVVEEETPVVESRLEATALAAACAGVNFKAQLKIGGHIVQAIAVAPGQARLASKNEAQP